MVDYSMEDNTWNAKKELIAEWFDANPQHEGRRVIADGLFAIGDIQSDLRKKHWSSISGIFADLSNSPIGGGRRSLMTTAIKSDFDTYKAAYRDYQYTISYDMECGFAKTHGKSGGVLYRDMEDGRAAYADNQTKVMSLFLSQCYNAYAKNDASKRYFWDGTFTEEGYPNVTDNGGQEEE